MVRRTTLYIKSFSAFKHGHTLRKILAPTSSVQQLLQRQLSSLSDREKNVKIGWTRRRKCLEERQTYDLFEKICRAALTQIQDLLQKTPNEAKQNLGTRFIYILWSAAFLFGLIVSKCVPKFQKRTLGFDM